MLPSYQNSLCPKILTKLKDRLNLQIQITNGSSLLDRMTKKIVGNWIGPESYYRASYVDIKITINRDGSAQGVEFLNADADIEFKKSAVLAVLNSAPFHEVSELDEATFESKYQSLTIKFRGD